MRVSDVEPAMDVCPEVKPRVYISRAVYADPSIPPDVLAIIRQIVRTDIRPIVPPVVLLDVLLTERTNDVINIHTNIDGTVRTDLAESTVLLALLGGPIPTAVMIRFCLILNERAAVRGNGRPTVRVNVGVVIVGVRAHLRKRGVGGIWASTAMGVSDTVVVSVCNRLGSRGMGGPVVGAAVPVNVLANVVRMADVVRMEGGGRGGADSGRGVALDVGHKIGASIVLRVYGDVALRLGGGVGNACLDVGGNVSPNIVADVGLDVAASDATDIVVLVGLDVTGNVGPDVLRNGLDVARGGLDVARNVGLDVARIVGLDVARIVGLNVARNVGLDVMRNVGLDVAGNVGGDITGRRSDIRGLNLSVGRLRSRRGARTMFLRGSRATLTAYITHMLLHNRCNTAKHSCGARDVGSITSVCEW